jgi:hypothetical protein
LWKRRALASRFSRDLAARLTELQLAVDAAKRAALGIIESRMTDAELMDVARRSTIDELASASIEADKLLVF